MESYIEQRRRIPVAAETDVLVVGGGIAGVSAALAAADASTPAWWRRRRCVLQRALYDMSVSPP